MDYGDLFTRAWRIVWHNKFMFVLGFLASLGAGGSSRTGNFTTSFDEVPTDIGIQLRTFLALYLPAITALICIGLFIAVALWLLRLTTQAGLISAASQIDNGEKVTFGNSFTAGLSKLGTMLGINVILYGPFFLLGLLMAAVTLGLVATAAVGESIGNIDELVPVITSLGVFLACIGLTFCAMLPLVLLVTIIYPFAQRAAVLDDLGVTDSIRHGWLTVRQNIAGVALLIIIFIVLGLVYGIVVFAITLPLAAIALFPLIISVLVEASFGISEFFLLACGGLIIALIISALNAVLVAFRSAVVTLAYQEFQEKKLQ